jgi:hypothetical protein
VKLKGILRETLYWTLVDQDLIQWQAFTKMAVSLGAKPTKEYVYKLSNDGQ